MRIQQQQQESFPGGGVLKIATDVKHLSWKQCLIKGGDRVIAAWLERNGKES